MVVGPAAWVRGAEVGYKPRRGQRRFLVERRGYAGSGIFQRLAEGGVQAREHQLGHRGMRNLL